MPKSMTSRSTFAAARNSGLTKIRPEPSISTSNARGLAGGSIYTASGELAVTVIQEGLTRINHDA
jgi:hypothetical protein